MCRRGLTAAKEVVTLKSDNVVRGLILIARRGIVEGKGDFGHVEEDTRGIGNVEIGTVRVDLNGLLDNVKILEIGSQVAIESNLHGVGTNLFEDGNRTLEEERVEILSVRGFVFVGNFSRGSDDRLVGGKIGKGSGRAREITGGGLADS